MPRLICLDTYYPEAISAIRINPAANYETSLRDVMYASFGTFDAYTRNLNALGWETMDVIVNHTALQGRWAHEHGYPSDILAAQIEEFRPDVIFLQDLNIQLPQSVKQLIAGQCSCPLPPDTDIRKCDVIFTSLPGHIPQIEILNVRAVYNPLAFDPIVFNRVLAASRGVSGMWDFIETADPEEQLMVPRLERIHDVVFVGGVGAPSHWKRGMETLEAVARHIPTFKWWGYGAETLHRDSPLLPKYQGPAWGLDMYQIFLQSKIVLNRHGEVAEGYANNMRMFEATGCGALLLTETAANLFSLFDPGEVVPYDPDYGPVKLIQSFLRGDWDKNGGAIAKAGQARTLRDHTYAQRMKTVSDTLKAMLP
jgi:Glycosyl transferases group 1